MDLEFGIEIWEFMSKLRILVIPSGRAAGPRDLDAREKGKVWGLLSDGKTP